MREVALSSYLLNNLGSSYICTTIVISPGSVEDEKAYCTECHLDKFAERCSLDSCGKPIPPGTQFLVVDADKFHKGRQLMLYILGAEPILGSSLGGPGHGGSGLAGPSQGYFFSLFPFFPARDR